METNNNLVEVDNLPNVIDAEIKRAKLEFNGIPSVVIDAQLSSINWFYVNALKGVKLCVSEKDYDKALEILSEHSEDINIVEAETDFTKIYCPKCHSNDLDLKIKDTNTRFAFINKWVTNLIQLQEYKCKGCGFEGKI